MQLKKFLSIICLFVFILSIGFFAENVEAFPQKPLPSQAQGPNVEKIKAQLDRIIEHMDTLPEQARAQERIMEIRKRIEEYQALMEEIITTPREWCYTFENDLGIGDNGKDVESLHKALKEEGFSVPSDDSFSLLTASSVVGFQQKYQKDILESLGFSYGTGFVCSSTREKLNEIYSCEEEGDDEDLLEVEVSVETDKEVYVTDESIEIVVKAKNNSEEDVTLNFSSGCQTYYEIGSFSNESRPCTMALTSVDIVAGEEYTWQWSHDSEELSPGEYEIKGVVIGYGEDIVKIEIEE